MIFQIQFFSHTSTFQMLTSFMWLVATLSNVDREHVHEHWKFCGTVLMETFQHVSHPSYSMCNFHIPASVISGFKMAPGETRRQNHPGQGCCHHHQLSSWGADDCKDRHNFGTWVFLCLGDTLNWPCSYPKPSSPSGLWPYVRVVRLCLVAASGYFSDYVASEHKWDKGVGERVLCDPSPLPIVCPCHCGSLIHVHMRG